MKSQQLSEIPTVDWRDLDNNREKFMSDLRFAPLNVASWFF